MLSRMGGLGKEGVTWLAAKTPVGKGDRPRRGLAKAGNLFLLFVTSVFWVCLF